MTIYQAINNAVKNFKKAKIKNPHLEAEILLSHVLKKTREYILIYPEKKLSKKQLTDFNNLISRRIKGEPIAYLTGCKEFYGFKFKVNKNVLVPRPETELMIEEALKIANYELRIKNHKISFIDIGTGSGCIVITLAKILKNKKYKFLASDISKSAVNIAKQNAKTNKVDKKIKFFCGDLLNPLIKKNYNKKENFIILANLPYGWKAWKNNCSMDTVGLKFEPSIALFTEKNGLLIYEKFLKQIKILCDTCHISHVFCEFDPRQTINFKKLIKKHLPMANVEIKKDLGGHNRLAIISF